MQDTRPAAPRLGTPLIVVLVNSIDIGKVWQGRDGGLLGTLAAEEVGGRLGQDDADRDGALVLGQSFDNDGDCCTLGLESFSQ